MAKNRNKNKTAAQRDNTSTNSERYVYYDKLHFVPIEEKNEVWAAQVLAFMKLNSVPIVSSERADDMRALAKGEINKSEYKRMIDPVTKNPNGTESGGEANYFHADWKACPIYIHLDNIMETRIKQIALNLNVKASDEFAQLKKQKENSKIIGRKQMTDFLNEMNKMLGYPPLSKFDDPFKYAEQLSAGQLPPPAKKSFKAKPNPTAQAPESLMDSVKASIDDNESLALYNEFIRKDGVEIACEIGINHYMIDQNKYVNKARAIVKDIKDFNAHTIRFYTSQTTGLPVTEVLDPAKVWTLQFEEEDMSDNKGWYTEYEVTFGDFVQMFGANRTPDELRDIFEAHRKWNNIIIPYERCGIMVRKNAKIQIGYAEFETQDMEVYSVYEQYGNTKVKQVSSDFQPETGKRMGNGSRIEKHFNVWRKLYYMPLLLGKNQPNYNSENQARYIYDYGKLQDQQREGDDFRYAKCSLFGSRYFKSMSWSDIVSRFMPKINFLWFRFQNEMVQAIPNGAVVAKQMVSRMATVADSAKNDNTSSEIELAKSFKQTGWGVLDFMVDEKGQAIGDGMPIKQTGFTMMESAFKNLEGMMQLYNLMMQSLSQNNVTEGAGSKPRQNATGIELSADASSSAQYFIEEQYLDSTLELGKRFIYYFKDIVDRGDSDRLEGFMNIVGEASGYAFQAIKEIPLHNLGLSVNNVMNDTQKQLIFSLAEKLGAAGILMPEDIYFISTIDDPKYAFAILSIKAKQGRKLAQQQQDAQNNAIMESKKMDMQLELTKMREQGNISQQLINIEKGWDLKIDEIINRLKGELQLQVKDKTGQNKSEELITQSNIDRINHAGKERIGV